MSETPTTGGGTPTRIVILANHQHAGLAAALRALLPAAKIDDFNLANLVTDGPPRRLAVACVGAADHIISHDAAAQFGKLSTASLRAARRPVQLLPAFRFSGFHPDIVTITLDGREILGPTGPLHSRIAAAAYMAGLSASDTASLYSRLVFARLGYFDAFDAQRATLIRTFAVYGYDLAPLFDGWMKPGCFMFDATRPRMRVLLDLGRRLCERMCIDPAAGASEATVQNPLAGAPMQPLFADIAARIGVSPEGSFRGVAASGTRPPLLSLDDFIAASFAVYKRVPLAALRATPGMSAALEALYLQEADFGREAARMRAAAAPPDDTMLLTWHGKLLCIETATGTLVQTAPWPPSADFTPVAVRLNRPLAAPTPVALGGGTVAASGPYPGTITLTQQDRVLTATPHLLAPRFVPAHSSPQTLFLPLARADLGILRAIAAGHWAVGDDETTLCGAAVHLRPGFVLAAGPYSVDLAAAQFSRTPAADQPVRIDIKTPEQTITLTACDDRQAGGRMMPFMPGDLELVPVAASLEQFRAAPNYRVVLSGPGELIHLPLTVDDTARRWLADAQPALGRRHLRATAVRAADAFVRLDRGAEGVIFAVAGLSGGVFAGADCGSGADGLAPDAIAAAPKLGFPVCVFYKPNAHGFFSWLAEAALTLHVLQPMLPPEGRLLLPGAMVEPRAEGAGALEWLAALGLAGAAVVRTQAKLVHAADVTWLAHDAITDMPAFLVQSFRARCHALHTPPAARRRVYLASQDASSRLVETFLHIRGFETVVAEDLAPAAFIALFAAAEFIVAPHGDVLAGLLFCQAGTRVLELSPDTEFQPQFWQISEKLGLCHAVLPCPAGEVDLQRFRALFRMLRLTEA